MNAQEYNARVAQWATEEKGKLRANISMLTRPHTGGLRSQLGSSAPIDRSDGEVHRVAFRFLRYGAFVAYGVGRGYVRRDGQLVRGSKNAKTKVRGGALVRQPKDWFDAQLKKDIDSLADIAGEYYGDKSMDAVLSQIDRMTIVKGG